MSHVVMRKVYFARPQFNCAYLKLRVVINQLWAKVFRYFIQELIIITCITLLPRNWYQILKLED